MRTCETYNPEHGEFRLHNSPFYLMAHADYKYHENMNLVLENLGVSKPIYRVMTVLRELTAASIGSISEMALIKRSTVSRILDRMIEKKLVVAQNSSIDNRIVEVRLTAAGWDTLRKLTPAVSDQFMRATDGISGDDLFKLVRTLRTISYNLGKISID